MTSHNSKSDTAVREEPVRIVTEHRDVRNDQSILVDETELSIAEDHDSGGDPYNTTGQHVIIKPKYTTLT